MEKFIDLAQPSLYVSAASILFNPTFWNIAARQEYHNKVLTKLAGGNPRYGCYVLAATIFSLGLIRDALCVMLSPLAIALNWLIDDPYRYATALEHQPRSPTLESSPYTDVAAYGLLAIGNVLVLSSMYALGVTGTYLGDYFGILMDKRVTSFPFNVTDAPMYWGSTCSFVGGALLYRRPAGLVLSVLVWLCYRVALTFEDPFTAEIYAKRDQERTAKGKGRATRSKKAQ